MKQISKVQWVKSEKFLWRTRKLIEEFQSKDFEIIVEYKLEGDEIWICRYELRKKNSSPTPYSWYIDWRFSSLSEAQTRFLDFLEDNFNLVPFVND